MKNSSITTFKIKIPVNVKELKPTVEKNNFYGNYKITAPMGSLGGQIDKLITSGKLTKSIEDLVKSMSQLYKPTRRSGRK